MNLRLVALALTLLAIPAHARFGKGGGSSSSGGQSGSSSSSHGSTSAGRSSSSSGSYHAATPVSSGSVSGGGSGWGFRSAYSSPWRYGYYSGCYVPRYGYGYGFLVGGTGVATASTVGQEETSIRVTAGVEGMLLLNTERGLTLGLTGQFEGENWGLVVAAQNIAVKSLDGPEYDSIQQVSARLTYSFLNGKYGRLRAELGVDTVFAPDLIALGPTGGLSGSLWIGGPVALEGSVTVTPYPFLQLDYRAGVAVGVGPVGLRAGWRTQVLDDRGLVDGVIHKDTFMGPYVGVSLVF